LTIRRSKDIRRDERERHSITKDGVTQDCGCQESVMELMKLEKSEAMANDGEEKLLRKE
jgi:hypothetical protein